MATEKVIIYKGIPYFSNVKVPTRVSQLANDAGYVTTDEKVKQTPNTTSLDSHPILFSASDSSGEVVGGTYKNPDFYYNPSLNRMIFENGGGIEARSGAASVSVLSQYIHLSDPTDTHSIMNVTANDIELEDVTYQGTTYSNTWDGTNTSLKSSIGSLKQSVSDLELDTIRLTNQTTTGQGLIITNLNYDGHWISAEVAGGYYASFRPSAANKLVIRLVDDNGNAANSKTVTVILYHLGTIN